MEAVNKMKEIDISKGAPILIVGCVVNNALVLYDNGIDPTLTDMLIPSFITFFGSSLLANIIYTQIEFNKTTLLCFFVGTLLFTQLKNMPGIYALTSIFPVVGKALMLQSMKNNTQPLHNVVLWLLASEFFNELLFKQILNKKKLQIPNIKLVELLLLIFGLGISRKHSLPDYHICLLVVMISYLPKLKHIGWYFRARRDEVKEPLATAPKTPKRRAAAIKAQRKE